LIDYLIKLQRQLRVVIVCLRASDNNWRTGIR
jgi:hypothetical protein